MPIYQLTYTVLVEVNNEDEATVVGGVALDAIRDAGYDTTFEHVTTYPHGQVTRSADKSIIIAGSIFEGFRFCGPFRDHDDAVDWGDENITTDYLVATLDPPIGYRPERNN